MQVVLRIVARRGGAEEEAGQSEIGVEIFGAGRPALVEPVVDAGAQRVTQAYVAGVGILVARGEVDAREARARPGDAAAHERRPAAHVVADPAAQGREVFELFGGRARAGGAIRQDLVGIEIVGEGGVELDAQHQPRGEVMLVAGLQAAGEGAVGRDAAVRRDSDRIGERGAGVAEQVADMAADIEAAARGRIVGACRRRELQRGEEAEDCQKSRRGPERRHHFTCNAGRAGGQRRGLRPAAAGLSHMDIFRHPERSRPTGGVVEGPVLVDAATRIGPSTTPRGACPSEVEGLGSGRDDGVFWSYAMALPAAGAKGAAGIRTGRTGGR